MFDKKVTLTIPEDRKVIKKRIGGKEIEMYDYILESEILYCLRETLDLYTQDTFTMDKSVYTTPIELYANMDILVIQLCTNIDISNIAFDEMCKLGVHEFLEKNLKGYGTLKNAVAIGVQHIHTIKILEIIGKMATIDELEETTKELSDIMENGLPDNVRDLVMVQIAENPQIAEVFNNLTNGVGSNGLNE